jgi:hypothetical protein
MPKKIEPQAPDQATDTGGSKTAAARVSKQKSAKM